MQNMVSIPSVEYTPPADVHAVSPSDPSSGGSPHSQSPEQSSPPDDHGPPSPTVLNQIQSPQSGLPVVVVVVDPPGPPVVVVVVDPPGPPVVVEGDDVVGSLVVVVVLVVL